MPFVNESELAKAIRNGEISSLYYFYGNDVATIEIFTKKLITKLVNKENETYNFHKFEGKAFNVNSFSDVCESLPMFSDRVCIAINDLNADSMNNNDFEDLMNTLSDIPETTTVIIYATGIDLFNGKKFLIGKNKKISDLASKSGFACEFSYKKPPELVKYISDRVNKKGSSISKKTAEYLAFQCLSNIMLINSEIDKLCDYSNGEEITNDTVDLLVSKQLDSNAFALAKAISQHNGKLTMTILNELYEQQTDAIAILSAISMAFIDLYRARLANNSGISQSDVKNDFSYKKREFAVTNAFRDSHSISAERLSKCIMVLSETDIALKSSKTDSFLILEQAITSMLTKS